MLKLGLDNILIHLQKPPLDDLPNFLGYCSTWAKLLDGHHDSEGNISAADPLAKNAYNIYV